MPSSHKRKKTALFQCKSSTKLFGDVTINHFANSPLTAGKGRLKKSITNGLITAQKNLTNGDPLDTEIGQLAIDQEPLDPNEEVVRRRGRRRLRSSTSSSGSKEEAECDSDQGKHYPIDIWFLLADYIEPSNVLTFSLICKSSYHVVNTPKFWISLYKRCKLGPNLPRKLQPHCLEMHHGLKPVVIHALFLTYPPTNSLPESLCDLHSLVGLQCHIMWFEKTKKDPPESLSAPNHTKSWVYKFKLSNKNYKQLRFKPARDNGTKCDINANPDEGCKMLKVESLEYRRVPCVVGMRLREVVSSAPRALQLVFSSSPLSSSKSELGNITLQFSLSQQPLIVNWWHPIYYYDFKAH